MNARLAASVTLEQAQAEMNTIAAALARARLLLAWWTFSSLVPLLPIRLPNEIVRLDLRISSITVAASTLTGVLFGAMPALGLSRIKASDELNDTGRSTSAWGRRVGTTLVTCEIALALVLLTGAGLMLRTLLSLYVKRCCRRWMRRFPCFRSAWCHRRP